MQVLIIGLTILTSYMLRYLAYKLSIGFLGCIKLAFVDHKTNEFDYRNLSFSFIESLLVTNTNKGSGLTGNYEFPVSISAQR